MKRLLIIAVIAVIVAPAFAGSDVLPITGTEGILSYNTQSGQITPVTADTRRIGPTLWACTETQYYFSGFIQGYCMLDWADITSGVTVGGFGFNEFTNSQAADGDNTIIVVFYVNDDGWGDTRKQIVAGYEIANIPGSTHPINEYWGYLWRVEPNEAFVLDGDDLDGDGLDDFSYAYFYQTLRTPGTIMGPELVAGDSIDPNIIPAICSGIQDVFDRYINPDLENDPNMALSYDSSRWYGGATGGNPTADPSDPDYIDPADFNPFAQFYCEIFAPGCPNPGAHFKYCAGDIGNFNCIVDLADLAHLLGNYGILEGATYPQGDIEPPDDFFPGDGDIDLADLAEMLGQYGDDCNL